MSNAALLIVALPMHILLTAMGFGSLIGLGLSREAPVLPLTLSALCVAVLPSIGIGAMFGGSLRAQLGGGVVWPLLLVLGLPIYFPGERSRAMGAGAGFFAAPWGTETAMRAAAKAESFGLWLGDGPSAISGTPPSYAEPVIVEPKPVVAAPARVRELSDEDEISLPYEGEGRSLRIPVGFEQGEKAHDLTLMFDTGATFTTLDRETLERVLGLSVPRGAPEVVLQTANGERRAQVMLIDRVWLGGYAVEGVTIAVCEECASEDSAGLLGLNVSGQFTVTVDPDLHELTLKPRTGDPDRQLDISKWLKIEGMAKIWSDGRVTVDITAESLVNRPIRSAEVLVECGEAQFRAPLGRVEPLGVAESKVNLPLGVRCDQYMVRLGEARW
ncbi:MAG: retropepsin-like domain-containing protein [Deltaproteobacteria bacterium]|nr:retropepsin-like domain-containing protein [Deltaproteobacteria bacterium]